MNAKLLLVVLALMFSTVSVHSQTVVTFDDLSDSASGSFIPAGYQRLNWSNFAYSTPVLSTNMVGLTGYYYGMVSAPNVALNAAGNPAEIDSATNFNFLSAYLTGAWNSNLNVEVEGFNGTNEIYNTIVVASATNPTLFTFNYFNIDRLYFDSYGGLPAFSPNNNETQFVMDNLTVEFIPEPSSLLLTVLGAVTLWGVVRRKRC